MEEKRKTGKQSYDELENSAQGLLRRLNSRYDATRVEAEKSAMKNLDDLEDPDAKDPDVLAYMPTEEVEISDSLDKSVDTGEISAEELQKLYDKYLGGETKSDEPVGYDDVHQQILDAEQRSGVESLPLTDVEKNIDEAEKYIASITANASKEAKTEESLFEGQDPALTEEELAPSLDDEESLSAYAPTITAEPVNTSEKSYFSKDADVRVPEIPTDTAMMKAFGLDPQKEAVKDMDPLFGEFSLSDTGDLQSTQEISARELEGEQAEPIALGDATPNAFEYTEPSQNKAILSAFRSKHRLAKVKMIGVGLLAFFLFLLENVPSFGAMMGGSVNFIAVDWLLSFSCVAIVLDRLIHAAKSLAKFEFDSDSITLVAFVLSLIATIVSLCAAPRYALPRLYNFPLAVVVLLSTISEYISLGRDVYAFKIISSGKVKKTISRTSFDDRMRTPEEREFADYIADGDDVCTVKKTDFVSDFFARRKESPRIQSGFKILIPACFGVALLFFFLAKFAMDQSISESFGTAYATFLMTVPFASFFSFSYPMYLASRRAYIYNSAIVGDKTPEEYENTSVIAFRDDDAFPAGKIKVGSIKIYADRNIENVIYYASSLFSKIGGPLATVFKQATLNSINSEDVEIREVANTGVCALVDGKHIVVGRPSYMEEQCFETMPEQGDEEYEGRSKGRILYLACEQNIIAKFYIQYSTTSDFLYIAHHLVNSGVCLSIRTADPCIDDGILYDNKMDPEKFPIRIIKGFVAEEKEASISAKDGGVVSVGSAKDMVKTLLLCDKLENVKKTNFVLKAVAAALGVAVMGLVLFAGGATGMLSLFPALYQLFWLLPTVVVSKIYI